GLERRIRREMYPLDVGGRELDAVVQDDAHEMGERVRPVPGAADRTRIGRHQMAEGITLFPPILENAVEGVFLLKDADAHVLGVLVLSLEEPTIDLLALRRAGAQDLCPRRLGMRLEVGDEP